MVSYMSSLLRSNIENGIASEIAHSRDGTKGETHFAKKIRKYDGTAPCGTVLLKKDGPYLYKLILRRIKAEKVNIKTAESYSKVEFKRKISTKQCFEHIETDLMYKGKSTHPDSRHDDCSSNDYLATSFIEAHVGQSIADELQKVYKEIIRNDGKIKRMIGKSKTPEINIILVRDIFFVDAMLPVLVNAIEITVEYRR